MEPVLYFKVLSLALGTLLVLRGPVVTLIERKRRQAEAVPVPRGRPPFIAWLGAILALIVVAATWWMQARHPVDGSFVVTAVATLSVFWASQVLFNYARFRELQRKLSVARPGLLGALRVAVALAGVALILLGLFLYR